MNKYHAKAAYADGIKFSSTFERNRYLLLKGMEDSGEIKDLMLQVKFEIIPKQDGERAAHYIADFVYEKDGNIVVEDTKGFSTPDYILKRKLMMLVHGIRIQEVRLGEQGKSNRKKYRKK